MKNCPKCNCGLEDAPGIGLYCPNYVCNIFDDLEDTKITWVEFKLNEFKFMGYDESELNKIINFAKSKGYKKC